VALKLRFFHLPPHLSREPSDDQPRDQERDQCPSVRGIAHPKRENRRNKEEIQAKVRDDGNDSRRYKIPDEGLQYHDNEIKEPGYGEIQPQRIADDSDHPDKKSARDSSDTRTPEPPVFDSLHA
jgi:hypothetical protein